MKRILVVLILLTNTVLVYAQQYGVKNLLGRWQGTRSRIVDMAFFNDSTAIRMTSDGLLYSKIKYLAKINKDIIELKYTIEPGNKKNYQRLYIKFLDDSTLLIRYGSTIPQNADSSNKKVITFKKIKKEIMGTEIRFPGYNDLFGQWMRRVENKKKQQELLFVDQNTVFQKSYSRELIKMRYVVDFSKLPIPIDFYQDQRLIFQAFIRFYTKDILRFEFYMKNDRKNNFTDSCYDCVFLREKGKVGISN